MENKLFEFKVGDKVKCAFFGDEVFELTSTVNFSYPLAIRTNGERYTFTLFGKSHEAHTHPVLTLVERPKRKEKRTVTRWMNVHTDNVEILYSSKKAADLFAANRIACVEITGEYEVEVEG